MKNMMKTKSDEENVRPAEGTYEVNFGYHPKTKVHTKPSSHIPELCEILTVLRINFWFQL